MTSQLEEKTLPSNDHSLVQAVAEGGSDGSPRNADGDDTPSYEYLQGLRFWLVTTSLAVMVFMVNLEIPVVTTSLVTISEELGGFAKSSWVVSGYLLGYVAVIIVFAKLSDIFGRKPIYLLSMSFFIIFSAACSAAQTMMQLIIFRAFQGVGGGGCFSLSTIIITELVPKSQYTKYVSQLSIVTCIALLSGPIIGGAISSNTTWRWIFIINVPISAIAFGFAVVGFPWDFPFQGKENLRLNSIKSLLDRSTRDKLDILGAILLLCAVLSLTAGFEEADAEFPWKSAYVIVLLVSSAIFWLALLLWERHVTLADTVREPVLPWRFFVNRNMAGILLSFVLLGGPVIVPIFQIPQRLQLVNGLSGLDAGVRLIPFTMCMPVGTVISAILTTRLHIAPIWVIMGGACLQTLGFALLGTLPVSLDIPSRTYGFEILSGIGCGINYTLVFLLIPYCLHVRDHGTGMGAGSQFRMIGSAIVVAITTAVFNSLVRPRFATLLGISDFGELADLSRELRHLPTALQEQIRLVLSEAYNRQMLVLCGFSAAQVPAASLLWNKKQIKV